MLGMAGCLAVGCSAAKTLAVALDKPLVGVHHMVSTDHAVSSQADSFSPRCKEAVDLLLLDAR